MTTFNQTNTAAAAQQVCGEDQSWISRTCSSMWDSVCTYLPSGATLKRVMLIAGAALLGGGWTGAMVYLITTMVCWAVASLFGACAAVTVINVIGVVLACVAALAAGWGWVRITCEVLRANDAWAYFKSAVIQ